jgi:hypothetical protein
MARVERYEHEAAGRDREVQLEVPVAVRTDDRHAVAALESHRAQRADETLRALVQLGVREALLTADDRGLLGRNTPAGLERGEERRRTGRLP